jgi:hypothetical protein
MKQLDPLYQLPKLLLIDTNRIPVSSPPTGCDHTQRSKIGKAGEIYLLCLRSQNL